MVDFGPKLAEDRLSELLKECDCGVSTAPGSTLSIYSDDDRDTESDIYSSSWNVLEQDGYSAGDTLKCDKSIGSLHDEQGKDTAFTSSLDSYFPKHDISLLDDRFRPEKGNQDTSYFSGKPEQFPSGRGRSFLPMNSLPGQGQIPRAPSPGISTMMLSLVDHPWERPCSPTASTLYKNTVTHCNPSWLGQCTFEECVEFTQWVNDFFKYGRVETRVNDLARDLGDGITLLDFVEVLVGTAPPQVHVKPALAVQKLENIHVCLQFLARNGVAIQELTAEDIVQGNLKVVLALCHCLRRHFGSASGPVLLVKSPRYGQQKNVYPPTKSYQPLVSSVCFDSDSPGCSADSATLNKGDVSILRWVGSVISQELVDFKVLQSGTVLCLLLNKIAEGSIPDVVIKYGLPSEKISLALQVSRKDFGVISSLSADDVLKGRSRGKLSNYLRSLQQHYFHRHSQREHSNLTKEQKGDQESTYFDLSVEKDTALGRFGIEHLTTVQPSKISTKHQLSRSKEKLAQLNRELKLLKMAVSDETDSVSDLKDGFERDAPDCLGESYYFSNLSFESEYSKAKNPGDSKNEGPTYRSFDENTATCERAARPAYASFGNAVKSPFQPNSTYPPSNARSNISRPAKAAAISREQRTSVLVNSDGLTYNNGINRASGKLDFTPSNKKVLKELNALKRARETVKGRDVERIYCSTPMGRRSPFGAAQNHNSSAPETSRNDTVNQSQRKESEQTEMSRQLHTMTALVRLSSKKANAVS